MGKKKLLYSNVAHLQGLASTVAHISRTYALELVAKADKGEKMTAEEVQDLSAITEASMKLSLLAFLLFRSIWRIAQNFWRKRAVFWHDKWNWNKW